jgi:hypothetical protein
MNPKNSGSGRVVVSESAGGWKVRWEDHGEIYRSPNESHAWSHAKRIARQARAEAILCAGAGEVRLRADFREDE